MSNPKHDFLVDLEALLRKHDVSLVATHTDDFESLEVEVFFLDLPEPHLSVGNWVDADHVFMLAGEVQV